MEKLIELLNEFEDYKEKETEIRNYTRRNVKCDGVERIECLREVDGELFWEDESTAIIICKGYMFIQWLVENDKIDKRKIDTRLVRNVESHYDEDWYWVENSYEDYSNTDTLLMLLAIQDEPIDFLCSLLK